MVGELGALPVGGVGVELVHLRVHPLVSRRLNIYHIISYHSIIQGYHLYMCFWYLLKRDLSSVRVNCTLDKSFFLQGTKNGNVYLVGLYYQSCSTFLISTERL